MKHGKGVIGIPTHFLGRYREFDICVDALKYPQGSVVKRMASENIPLNCNNAIRTMLTGDYKWVWIVGDDHVFSPNILYRLLDHNVDVVVPLCTSRSFPYKYYVFENSDQNYKMIGKSYLHGKTGLVDITGLATSNTGMLIRRHVVEDIIDAPWFENCTISRELMREDLVFCDKLRKHGIKLYIDTDTPMGHITHVAVWPARKKHNRYTHDIKPTGDIFKLQRGDNKEHEITA